jgi:hypothetical protein
MTKIWLIAGLIFFSLNGFAEVRTARFFPIGKTSGEPLFTQETKVDTSPLGQTTWSSEIKDAKGILVMTEKATVQNDRTTHQYVEQLQIGEAYELNVEGDQATFRTFKIKDGKTGPAESTKPVTIKDNFVTSPATEFYLQKRWSDILAGAIVPVEFGIFELSRTIGFEFKKLSETEDRVELRMKPSNFFVSMVASPMIMEFDKKAKKMVHFKGRTPVREMIGGKWKAIDAEIIYP